MRVPVGFSLGLLILLSARGAEAAWQKDAQHLIGGGDQKASSSRAKLFATRSLDRDLRLALNTNNKFLALDVIAALKRQSLFDDVVEFSNHDRTGFSYLTLNALITAANLDRVVKLYLARLHDDSTSPSAKVILIDALSQMKVRLEPAKLSPLLLKHASPEVRSAALDYLHSALLEKADKPYIDLLRNLLSANDLSDQRKIQALYIVRALNENVKRSLPLPSCPEDVPAHLGDLCPKSRSVKL